MRLVTLGVGALASPRYAPAGLLVAHRGVRVMIDGGPRAAPRGKLDAWLVCDERSELQSKLREMARQRGLKPRVSAFRSRGLVIVPRRVVHTNHPTFGFEIRASGTRVAWAPEFYRFPRWARGADLLFAEASSWDRPIRFVGGVGGHLGAIAVARAARRARVRRLVFAHLGRPTLRALDAGKQPPYGTFARDRQIFVIRRAARISARSPRPPVRQAARERFRSKERRSS